MGVEESDEAAVGAMADYAATKKKLEEEIKKVEAELKKKKVFRVATPTQLSLPYRLSTASLPFTGDGKNCVRFVHEENNRHFRQAVCAF